jgi:hypothetical protein
MKIDLEPGELPPYKPRYQPDNCPHCEYDRRFPETADGGWIYMGNNGPTGPCPVCNPHGTHPRS